MRRSRELVCGLCEATSEERRDQVPSEAAGYTCSRCLIGSEGSGREEKRDMEVGKGSMIPPPSNPLELQSSERGFSGTRRRGGRPALPPAERRRRETGRKRRWREAVKAGGRLISAVAGAPA